MLAVVGTAVLALGAWSWITMTPVPPEATSTAADADSDAGSDDRSAAPPVPEAPRGSWAPGAPRTLAAPAGGIRARVLPVRTRGSVLLPPADPSLLGWWSDGVPAGAASGTALLAGHAVSGGGGALEDVTGLESGDALTVRTAKGRVGYRVQQVITLNKAQLADRSEQLFRQDGPHRLALVTCADWDGEAFRSNTVVLASADSSGR